MDVGRSSFFLRMKTLSRVRCFGNVVPEDDDGMRREDLLHYFH